MLISDVIRAAIPNADESTCEHILWGRTAFPFISLTAKDIYRAASSFQRAKIKNTRLCDWCHRIAQEGKTECKSCYDALNNANDRRPND